MQEIDLAFARAELNAGRNIAARIAMTAITTRSSIKVKCPRCLPFRTLTRFFIFLLL